MNVKQGREIPVKEYVDTRKYTLEGLSCAQCAARIEDDLKKIDGLQDVSINFVTRTIEIDPGFEQHLRRTVKKHESDVIVKREDEQGARDFFGSRGGVFEKKSVLLLAAAGLFAAGLAVRNIPGVQNILVLDYILFGAAFLISGWKVLRTAFSNLYHGKIFDENFLMTIATAGALALGEVPEAAAVMIFYSLGEYLQNRAVEGSRRSIEALMDLRPEIARVIRAGKSIETDPGDVRIGEIIEIRTGERVPLDGRVVRGESFMDTSALTGESVPRRAAEGDEILAGSLNGEGLLQVEVTKVFENSAVMKIFYLVEQAAGRKAGTEKFITRFARYYTPFIVLLALGIAFLPPLLGGAPFGTWIYRALVLLVISCPCALVVSIPLSYFAGVGAAARSGVLVKGAEYLDRLLKIKTAVFDKTGTLTRGVFSVQKVLPVNGYTEEDILQMTALAEKYSNHPIALSIRSAAGNREYKDPDSYRELRGRGVVCINEGRQIAAGNERLMDELGVKYPDEIQYEAGTVVLVADGGVYAGYIQINDELKPETVEALRLLRREGIKHLVMLTGDGHHAAAHMAGKAGIEYFHSELQPEEKLSLIMKMEKDGDRSPVLFAGDGINDAPVLAEAHIGAAMGGIGSDAAIEAADIVLMRDDLRALPQAMRISSFTRRIVLQNIGFSLGVKIVAAAFGVAGIATMWAAVFADVGVTLLAVANALRILRRKNTSL